MQQVSQSLWTEGLGVIQHSQSTRQRIDLLVNDLEEAELCDRDMAYRLFKAADGICNMAMWLVVHMTYARLVRTSGQPLFADEFKSDPQGHTGGALNMVPAYVGYMLANALTGKTRSWLMGQGHCVAAIEATNVIVGNTMPPQTERYPLTERGLSQLCADFYCYQHDEDGVPVTPLGSHVNMYTAGGIMEGGYLGFASLQYPHMPLPGQELVAFLSDGAFEEQRGSDWATRWWRGEDTGVVTPVLIANGRRIEQRTSSAQRGGTDWLVRFLGLQGFDPIVIDGRDPAAYAWAIIWASSRLGRRFEKIQSGERSYPVRLPYVIAETEKGYGFPGAGTNAAHNLPLVQNPRHDATAREQFDQGAAVLFQPIEQVKTAVKLLNNHSLVGREREKDHALCRFKTPSVTLPQVEYLPVGESASAMRKLDSWFSSFVEANPKCRFRIGNPDELRSNYFAATLERLKHRVVVPESDNAESILGGVISALNEEAVASAAFANKQGVNLIVSYEAFATKMQGAMRQEAIFARNLALSGRRPQWLAVPVLLSSHTWENGKNEISHQDPSLCETWMGEMQDVAPVYFPFDANSAVALFRQSYKHTARIPILVVPKRNLSVQCSPEQACRVAEDGALVLQHDDRAQVQLIAIGAYQLAAAQIAAGSLRQQV